MILVDHVNRFNFTRDVARFVPKRGVILVHDFYDEDDGLHPDPARYGWILPNVVVVACILFTFAVITPLLTPFALAYFLCARVAGPRPNGPFARARESLRNA